MKFEDIDFIKYKFFDNKFNVGFDRLDTNEVVIQHRKSIAKYFDVEYDNMVIPNQVHSNNSVFIDRKTDVKGDALITNKKGLLIGVHTADCVPILVCDVEKKYIAAIHAGWRGAVFGIIENTIEKMQQLGCNKIYCKIGPCIHKESYPVGNDVASLVEKKYVTHGHLDILMYIFDKLNILRVKDVSILNIDTYTDTNYFSYRRDGRLGVQFSGIVLL